MIISQLTGGLGNQFFQYAMARRLAHYHGVELLVDVSNYSSGEEPRPQSLQAFGRQLGLFRFQVKTREATLEEVERIRDPYWRSTPRDRAVRVVRRAWPSFLWRSSHIIEHQYRFQPEALLYPDNVYLQGYWQSEKYFADIAPQIRRELRPLDASVTESALSAVEALRKKHASVVSLHVRRGDLAHAHEVLGQRQITYGAPVTMEYIEKSMREFSKDTCFFVFSDSPKDIEWCRENIRGDDLEFSNAESDMWDFAAMQQCDHHIIANSTFSWWAAWLDDKPQRRVIAPRAWSPPDSIAPIHPEDLLPKDWKTL